MSEPEKKRLDDSTGEDTDTDEDQENQLTTDAVKVPQIIAKIGEKLKKTNKPQLLGDGVGDLLRVAYDIGSYKFLAKPIIFNHKRYSSKHATGYPIWPRSGTKKDQLALTEMFKDLNCADPEIYLDEKTKNIKDILQNAATADHSDCACLIVVVLTHGDENQLFSYDGIYGTSDLWDPFVRSAKKNQTLAGKPKIFIIQACRGDDLDEEVVFTDSKSVSPPPESFIKKIPRCADFLIANSSFRGYKSVRNTIYGSWFIQTLCQAIKKHKSSLDLLNILTIVKYDIAYNRTFKLDKKQIPCTETTLTKMLFLRPKSKDDDSQPTENTDSIIRKPTVEKEDVPPQSILSATSGCSSISADHFAILGAILCITILFVSWLLKAEIHCNCNCNLP